MNAIGLRLLKSTYRKEPVVSFVITAGIVDAIIGTLGASGSLFCFGVGIVSLAVMVRGLQHQRSKVDLTESTPEYILPPQTHQTRLPTLK